MSCNVLWCDVAVMSSDVMRFFLCCVTSRHAMFCHVMRCHAIPYLKWNVQRNARSNSFTATQTHSHDSSPSHMKRHLQCAEQHWFPSNTTKYCACHEILSSRCQRKIPELLPPIERRFEDNPTMKSSSRTCRFGDLTRPILETHFVWKNNYNISRSGYLSKFHEKLRLPRKVTLQLHQILRLPRKMSLMIDLHQIWNVIYNARSNRSHPPTAPNTAPATQTHSHDSSSPHMKRHLQCAEQHWFPSNFTKYCACHAKWISWLIRVTYETSFTMRGAKNRTPQLHQILRLPRKMNLMIDPRRIWNVIYNARSKHSQPPTSPNTLPATKSVSSRFQRKLREVLPPIERRFEQSPNIIRT